MEESLGAGHHLASSRREVSLSPRRGGHIKKRFLPGGDLTPCRGCRAPVQSAFIVHAIVHGGFSRSGHVHDGQSPLRLRGNHRRMIGQRRQLNTSAYAYALERHSARRVMHHRCEFPRPILRCGRVHRLIR